MSLRPSLSSRAEFPPVERTHGAPLLFFLIFKLSLYLPPNCFTSHIKKDWVNLNEIIFKAEKSEEGWVG